MDAIFDNEQVTIEAALARLNQVGAAVNLLGSGDLANVETILNLIVESAVEVIPGASAVLYTYDQASQSFDPGSRVSAESWAFEAADDFPRPAGIGARALAQNRRVISYEEPDLEIHPGVLAIGGRVMCCHPLIVAHEALGALYVYLKDFHRFRAIELHLLDNFVNHAAMTLYLARQLLSAQVEQNRKNRELRRLHRAGLLIASPASVPETLEAILRMALEVIDAQYGIFRLVDKEGEFLVTHAFVGEGLTHPSLEPLPIDRQSIMGQVACDHRPVLIPDLREEPFNSIYYPLDPNVEMRSELAVPLIGLSGRLEGVLNLESPEVNAFSKQDRYLLQVLSTQAVAAIQRARLLNALQEISSLLMTAPCQQVLDFLVEHTCDLLNVEACRIWLVEDDYLHLKSANGNGTQAGHAAIGSSFVGQAVVSASPVFAHDLQAEAHSSVSEHERGDGWRSALVVPILNSEDQSAIGALGIFTLGSDLRDFRVSDWETKVLTILAAYTELAVQHEAHQEALRSSQEQRAVAETFAAVGDIAANLLHRLNNRIGTIPVRVEGIRERYNLEIEANQYLSNNLQEIEKSATDTIKFVRESLFNLRPIELAAVNVASSVEAALATANIPATVAVNTSGLQTLPAVKAGEQRLRLVFLNLLENAVDAMAGDGRIDIHGERQDEWVVISVKDSGPGIAPENQDHIFEFNFSGRTSDHPGKLGFGLWWVKSLLARFGGSVTVESDGRQGTTFIVRLPPFEAQWRT